MHSLKIAFCFTIIAGILLIATSATAQKGKIEGKILDENNKPVAGASVLVTGINAGLASDQDGRFLFTVDAGKEYEIQVTALGYVSKTISNVLVTVNQVSSIEIILTPSSNNLQTVTVKTSAKKETTNALIQFQKNTNTVAQVISSEAIRRSPDKNTGEVLKRIPGASIQEGKYLVVRGLSDRYNQAMLNGIQLSSTEPDRKTFSFDIFPSSMVDNIVINKAFVPEMTGEWAGGLVQVNTKDIPSQSFFNIQVGTGFNSQTIGKDFYSYKGGKLDWLGIDDGRRKLPEGIPYKNSFSNLSREEKTEWGKKFNNDWSYHEGSAPINTSMQISGGFNTNLFSKKFGGVIALTYSSNNRRLAFDNNIYNLNRAARTADTSFAYQNTRYSKDVLWGALANFALQIDNNNKISLKNVFNINATDYVTIRQGQDYEFGAGRAAPIRARELAFKSNTLYNTQLTGEHNINSLKSKLKWYGSFTILDQYIPDQKRLQYNEVIDTKVFEALINEAKSQKSGSIFYSNLSDYIYTAGADWTTNFKLFSLSQSVKGGYLFQVKDRLYNARPFSITMPSSNNRSLLLLPEEQIFATSNFGGNGFEFDEFGEANFRYLANSILNAGYIQLDNQFANWLRIVWGVRVEDFDQLVGSVKKSDDRFVNTKVTDFLPAVNATFKLNNQTNIRLTGSQTVIRPEFRELSNLAFYDFDLGATVLGNKELKRTKVTNLDLRYELYPRAGELFTVGVFYKYFKDAIEQFYNQSGAGSSSTFNFINADKATGYGAEVEFRKKLDFVSALRNFTFQTNLSYIYSRVESKGVELDRPLQGQSPYVINFALQYDVEKLGLNSTILFNQIGRRILYVGNKDVPEIWEAPRPLLDLQIAKKILKNKGEIRLNISDLINKRANFYHDLNEDKKYTANSVNDALAIRRNYGTNFSITFGYSFK
ncbi:TonB-dependent receptor [Foetidibacter luteolus]|uniref:TonB-dependent receptor n=1 Tax=Foetidibacter luteolus TaxID=2608880 RepID=UPI001A99CDB4|nr:TonB-dependent receptor [Foetidibacter luteolus]